MANTLFFAAIDEVVPILRECEASPPVQYLPSTWNTLEPPVYLTVQDIPTSELLEQTFFVMHRDVAFSVLPQRQNQDAEMLAYDIKLNKETPFCVLLIGRLVQNRYLECSSFSTADDFTNASYELYRPFAQAIRRNLQQIGYLYSAEALRLGANGIFYAWTMTGNLIHPHDAWTYRDVEAIRESEAVTQPRPVLLDQDASWAVLEQLGYEPPRDEAGRPAPPQNLPAILRAKRTISAFSARASLAKSFPILQCRAPSFLVPRSSAPASAIRTSASRLCAGTTGWTAISREPTSPAPTCGPRATYTVHLWMPT